MAVPGELGTDAPFGIYAGLDAEAFLWNCLSNIKINHQVTLIGEEKKEVTAGEERGRRSLKWSHIMFPL